MKKIGIITFQNANNYGAVYQAFALKKTVEKLGMDVKLINYDSPSMGLKDIQQNQFKDFIATHLNLTEEYVDKRSVTIALVRNESLYRKANSRALAARRDYIGSSVNSSRTNVCSPKVISFPAERAEASNLMLS